MKYHEAIDMILDGGEAYTKEDKNHPIYFDKRSALLCSGYDDTGHVEAARLYKDDLIGDNWIVEKDGVVYEEYTKPNVKQSKPQAPGTIQINEEWLEMKASCIIRKKQRYHHGHISYESIRCGQKNCPFCFPQEQTQNDHIPDIGKKVTVEEMMFMLHDYGNKHAELYMASSKNCCAPHDDNVKSWRKSRNFCEERIKQKLECLVSLQEK